MRFLTVLIVCLLLPSIASAALFSPPPTDKSVELLGAVFGTHMGSVYLGGIPNPALIRMFELFNSVIISIGTVIISYIGIVSTINTAQEGKTMGKKWNSIWIPLRATLGMVLIVPTPTSGYSVIQTMVMWMILQGIGAADQIWNGILGDLASGKSVNVGVRNAPIPDILEGRDFTTVQTLTAQGEDLTQQLLRSAVCMVAINNIASGNATMSTDFRAPADSAAARFGREVNWYDINSVNSILSDDEATYTGTAYIGIKSHERYFDVCGKYNITATASRNEWQEPERNRLSNTEINKKAYQIYLQKQQALRLMYSNLLPLAQEIVAERTMPRNSYNRLNVMENENIDPAGYFSLASNTYSLTMQTMVKPQRIPALQRVVREGSLGGWITAGSFYFALNHTNDAIYYSSVTQPPIGILIPKCDDAAECSDTYPTNSTILNDKIRSILEYHEEQVYLATRLWDAKVYLDHDRQGIANRLTLDRPDGIAPRYDLQHRSADWIIKLMTGRDPDPIIAQGKFGSSLMVFSEKCWADLLAHQQVQIDRYAQNNLDLPTEVRESLQRLNTYSALALSVYGILWGIGATLAIYIPLIPYMMFTIAVVGWFLLVIEAVVAAPILALSFILPSGEELGKIMQGLMLLLNILLRPTLMLFGFILATRLYRAVIQLVDYSIVGTIDNLDSGDSMYAWMAVIVIYGTFIVALANKCFSLIYAIPDKILRWMGGGPEHTDVSQEMHQVKGALSKGEETAKQISTGFGERELVRLQSQAGQLGKPADAVRGGGNTTGSKPNNNEPTDGNT